MKHLQRHSFWCPNKHPIKRLITAYKIVQIKHIKQHPRYEKQTNTNTRETSIIPNNLRKKQLFNKIKIKQKNLGKSHQCFSPLQALANLSALPLTPAAAKAAERLTALRLASQEEGDEPGRLAEASGEFGWVLGWYFGWVFGRSCGVYGGFSSLGVLRWGSTWFCWF